MNSSASAKKHVFISFSTDDRTYADKIINHLHKYNIPVWIDFKNLVPGTPDWDNAIKAAIHNSAVVLLLVSPNSIKSPFVKGEIAVALSRKVAVFPVWIHGASWEDCAPLHIIGTQYLDLRGNKLQQEIEQLDDLILPHLGRQKNKPQTKQKVKKQNQTDRKKRSKKIFLLIAIIICIVTALLFILFSPTQPKPVPSKRIEEIKEIEEFKKIQEIKETGSLKHPYAKIITHVISKSSSLYKINFDASKSYDPDGKIISYTWYIDGKKRNGNREFIEKLQTNKKYYIELVVIDNDGNKGTAHTSISF